MKNNNKAAIKAKITDRENGLPEIGEICYDQHTDVLLKSVGDGVLAQIAASQDGLVVWTSPVMPSLTASVIVEDCREAIAAWIGAGLNFTALNDGLMSQARDYAGSLEKYEFTPKGLRLNVSHFFGGR